MNLSVSGRHRWAVVGLMKILCAHCIWKNEGAHVTQDPQAVHEAKKLL